MSKYYASLLLWAMFLPIGLYAQCTLAIDSIRTTNVTCNGLSNGSATVFASGAQGTISFSNGATTVVSPSQPFSSSTAIANGSSTLAKWWSPNTCTGGAYFQYSAAQGCPAGSAVITGTSSGYVGCFLRSPQLNMNGIDHVTITFDLTHPLRATDYIRFYVWVNGGYTSVPTTINGTTATNLYFTQARSCAAMMVTLDLSAVPINNRSDFLFYIEPNCGTSFCNSFTATVDNIEISSGAPSQSSSTFSGLAAGNYAFTVSDTAGCTASLPVTISQPALLSASTNATNVSCFGLCNGSATVTPAGGTSGYTYRWNTNPQQTTQTAVNLCTGSYIVTVTDANNCTTTATRSVTQPTQLAATVNTTPESAIGSCNGTASVTVSGGTPNYLYAWSTSPTQTTNNIGNLCANTYCVTVSDGNGCSATACNSVTSPSCAGFGFTNVINSPPSCNGLSDGSITVAVTGGTGPYQYALNNGSYQSSANFSGLAAGSYTVKARDNSGCVITYSPQVVLTAPASLSVIVNVINDISCFNLCDGSAVAIATGGTNPYTYTWSNNANNDTIQQLCAGAYTVTVLDANNCSATTVANINQPPLLSIAITTTDASSIAACDGSATANVSGGISPYSYIWSNGAVTASINSLCVGQYCLTVTDNQGCEAINCGAVNAQGGNNCASLAIDSVIYNNANCSGTVQSGILVIASGGNGSLEYSINNGSSYQNTPLFNGMSAGSYYIQVRDDSNCIANFVGNPVVISSPVSLSPTIYQQGDTLSTDTYAAYAWYYNGSSTAVSTSQSYVASATGNYTLTVTDINGCTGSAGPLYVSVTGIDDIAQISYSIQPNPFKDVLQIVFEGTNTFVQAELYDIQGQRLRQIVSYEKLVSLPTNELAAGIYLLRLNINGYSLYKQVVKQ
ncbi:MAG: T9SS type A sorting domain-containing protein [Chitinophagales bacterium]|nr:T9SS type A sorting domain-containing protein [Chitinophagales bacterium]